ncbi:transmembrane protein 182-like [Dromiciops gliroides]|uniref:transmembrane protein 182-like n=1 Tax=Dromiciops gliroides TaxID=33562 RepID=UPI001CC640E1|nr:transmembrane protein 182-like [Dromiciops gliroides]
MKTGIGALLAGVVGVIGILLFLIAFGTEYWLLATEACGELVSKNGTLDTEMEGVSRDFSRGVLTFHHEGFFWRCWFSGEGTHGNVWKFWFTNQPRTKHCRPGYLFPMPIALGPLPHPSYDATAVYRGFWTVFIVLGVTASLVGVFLLVCGAPFVNARLYKFGGIFLITSGAFFLLLLLLFVLWKECAADFQKYILLERSEKCNPENAPVNVHYGWSFLFATAGTPLVYLSGLLFYLIGQKNMKVPK